MKRWTIRILICLLLGAMLNVAVAWGAALWQASSYSDKTGWETIKESNDPQRWIGTVPAGWPARPDFTSSLDIPLGRLQGQSNQLMSYVSYTYDFGWPIANMRCQQYTTSEWAHGRGWHSVMQFDLGAWVSGISFGRTHDQEPWLPIRPIFLPFVANVSLYAAIFYLLFFGRHEITRAIRHKRGRCIMCGYDLRGSPDGDCPECGWGRDDNVGRSC